MSWDPDWPATELKDILDEHGFRTLGRERRRSGAAPWRREISVSGRFVYDPDATWTETHYTIRRDVTCEVCGQWFGYSFEVDQISRVHRVGRSTDGALLRELGRQLRRRLRCPHCRAVQKDPRRRLLREDRGRTVLGCGLILGGLLLICALGALGGSLAGTVGFFIGFLVGLAAGVSVWFYGLPYILGTEPSVWR